MKQIVFLAGLEIKRKKVKIEWRLLLNTIKKLRKKSRNLIN